MKLPHFPHTVKKGNSKVTIYHYKNGKYHEFKVLFFSPQGRPKMESFADFQKAIDRANSINEAVNAGNIETLSLSRSEFLEYQQAIQTLSGTGTGLLNAAIQFAEAKKVLGPSSLIEAAEFYKMRHRAIIPKPISEIVKEYLSAKLLKGVSHLYLKGLEQFLGRFGEAFQCDLASIKSSDIAQFLNKPKDIKKACLMATTFNAHLICLAGFIKFSVRKKYLPPDWPGFEDVEPRTVRPTGRIEIYMPQEMAKLLSACALEIPNLKPEKLSMVQTVLALGAFSGMRNAEISRLDWQDIGAKYIDVKAENAKTSQPRLIPITENLRAWLRPHMKKSGRIWPYSQTTLHNNTRPIAAVAGIGVWKRNALRHSYISYRYAQISNINEVAAEAGNSPRVIFRHYREVVTREAAAEWFGLMPGDASDKITYLKTA